MSLFIQQTLNGIMLGGVYVMIALGLTLEYGILRVLIVLITVVLIVLLNLFIKKTMAGATIEALAL